MVCGARVNRYFFGLIGCALLAVSMSRPATAQEAPGLALDRFDPSERGSDWFVLDSLDIHGHLRPAIGVVGDWAYKPLVIYEDDGSERAALVRHQLFTHAGASLVAWDRVRFALNAPVALYQTGTSGFANGTSYAAPSSEKVSFGDLRLAADVRVVGRPGQTFSLAVGTQVHVPTGDRAQFTGDGSTRVVLPRLQVAGESGKFVYAGRLGFASRPSNDSLGGGRLGSEVVFGGAAGMRFANSRLLVGPELFGSTVVSNADAFFSKQGTPFEVLFGMRYMHPAGARVGAAFGPGLTRGFGSPELRFVVSVEWLPSHEQWERELAEPTDRDNDGVLDATDACPDVAGEKTTDPKTNGCPPSDRDGDGVPDGDDACPDKPGPRSEVPGRNGCPPNDRDKDGVPDVEDACPDVNGVQTTDPKTNGCPLQTDSDNDGVPDTEDACPGAVGRRSQDPTQNGCPGAEAGPVQITGQVKFKANTADILEESVTVLESVVKTLAKHREIQWVRVEGHADDRVEGKNAKALSVARAEAVVKWLGDHGVDLDRLMSQGFGSERPIDSNETEEGRKNNRRVEFHVGGTGK